MIPAPSYSGWIEVTAGGGGSEIEIFHFSFSGGEIKAENDVRIE